MNEHTGFELPLSDYEGLYCLLDHVAMPDFQDGVEQEWYGVGFGEAVFDLNMWLDEDTGNCLRGVPMRREGR